MPPEQTVTIERSVLLLVEGPDDRFFFEAFTSHLQLGDIQVLAVGGKDEVRARLRVLPLTPGFVDTVRALGIVRDADDNPKGAFQSVSNALLAAKLPVLHKPLESVREDIKVSVMILPDAQTPGMLETVCLQAVTNDPASECVDAYFDCLKRQGITPNSQALPKARLQAFLASRTRPGLRLGEAAKSREFPFEHAAFKQIREFLVQLVA